MHLFRDLLFIIAGYVFFYYQRGAFIYYQRGGQVEKREASLKNIYRKHKMRGSITNLRI